MENNFWRGKKVFVTGGTGFIGTHLVNELVEKGADVYCLVFELEKNCNFVKLGLDKKTTLIYGSMMDFEMIKLALEKHDIDSVFHLAAQPLVQIAFKKPSETIRTNVIGVSPISSSICFFASNPCSWHLRFWVLYMCAK